MPSGNETRAHDKTRILIVDDHPIVRQGLKSLLASEPDLDVCGEADNAPTAVELVRKLRPDLVIIDISLREGSGADLVKQIKHLNPDVRMLVSSVHDETIYAERVIRAGALGYIRKDENTAGMIDAVRSVLAGRIYLSGSMTNHVLQRLATGKEPDESPLSQLTDRELEVFQMIGQGLTTRQVAEKLCLSIKTVETHRENIKDKLNLDSGAKLSYYAVQWAARNS